LASTADHPVSCRGRLRLHEAKTGSGRRTLHSAPIAVRADAAPRAGGEADRSRTTHVWPDRAREQRLL